MSSAAWFRCNCGAEIFLCTKTKKYECYHCGAVHSLSYDPHECKELYGFFNVHETDYLETVPQVQ